MAKDINNVCKQLLDKGNLKNSIYNETFNSLKLIKTAALDFTNHYQQNFGGDNENVRVHFTDRNSFECQLKFGGDILIFLMHSNVFEFSRNHEVMKTTYIKEDKTRSYCGMIYIYNFLADFFKYQRVNDIGYLIGRLLINKEGKYYSEGKREIAQILNNFSSNTFNYEAAKEILLSAVLYTINFDLLVPDYKNNILMTVQEMMQIENQNMILKTGKRLGFRFEPDNLLKGEMSE